MCCLNVRILRHTEFILRIYDSSTHIIVLKCPRKCRTPLAFLMIVISQFCPYSFKIWEHAYIHPPCNPNSTVHYTIHACIVYIVYIVHTHHHHVDLSYCYKLTTIVQSEWFISYIEDAFYDEFKRDKLICAPSLSACLFLMLALRCTHTQVLEQWKSRGLPAPPHIIIIVLLCGKISFPLCIPWKSLPK